MLCHSKSFVHLTKGGGKRVESSGFLKRRKQITIMLEGENYILRRVCDKEFQVYAAGCAPIVIYLPYTSSAAGFEVNSTS